MNWKTIIVLVFVIVIGMLLLAKSIEAPYTEAIRVTVDIKGDNSSVTYMTVNASLIKILKKDVQKNDDRIIYPSVAIGLIQDMRVISYNRFLPYNGTGVYETDIGLFAPLQGDIVRVIVDVADVNGTGIFSAKSDETLNRIES